MSCRQAFLKEFWVVGQIYREGTDESGILPKARYAMTAGNCLEQLGRGLVGIQGAQPLEAPAILQYTVPKHAPKESLSLYIFICVQHTN